MTNMISYREACRNEGLEFFLCTIELDPESYAMGAKKISGGMGLILKKYAEMICDIDVPSEPESQCIGCLNACKILAEKTLSNERTIYIRKHRNDVGFDTNKSRFQNETCDYCTMVHQARANELRLYKEFCNKYNF